MISYRNRFAFVIVSGDVGIWHLFDTMLSLRVSDVVAFFILIRLLSASFVSVQRSERYPTCHAH